MSSTAQMTNFTFKMDQETRDAYSKLCNSLGLTMSSATLALVKQAVRDQSMSFSLRDEKGFTPGQAAELQRRIDIEGGKRNGSPDKPAQHPAYAEAEKVGAEL